MIGSVEEYTTYAESIFLTYTSEGATSESRSSMSFQIINFALASSGTRAWALLEKFKTHTHWPIDQGIRVAVLKGV
jgi:hypothetical protein